MIPMFKSEFQFRVSNMLAIHFGHTWGGLATWDEVRDLSDDEAGKLLCGRAKEGPAGWGITYPSISILGHVEHTTASGRYSWEVTHDTCVIEICTKPLVDSGKTRPMVSAIIVDNADGGYMVADIDWSKEAKDSHISAMHYVLSEVFGNPQTVDVWHSRVANSIATEFVQ